MEFNSNNTTYINDYMTNVSDIIKERLRIINKICVRSDNFTKIESITELLGAIDFSLRPVILLNTKNATALWGRHIGKDTVTMDFVLDLTLELRARYIGDTWDSLVDHIASTYGMLDVAGSIIPSSVKQELPSKESAKAILVKNPWLVTIILITLTDVTYEEFVRR